MSNKLKTLSRIQLEELISKAVGDYLEEECSCKVTEMSYESFNDENEIALNDDRDVSFRVRLKYKDPIITH